MYSEDELELGYRVAQYLKHEAYGYGAWEDTPARQILCTIVDEGLRAAVHGLDRTAWLNELRLSRAAA